MLKYVAYFCNLKNFVSATIIYETREPACARVIYDSFCCCCCCMNLKGCNEYLMQEKREGNKLLRLSPYLFDCFHFFYS